MSKIKQTKIPMILTEDGIFKIAVEQGVVENEFNWKLVREHDGLTQQSKDIKWLEWNEEGRVREPHTKPAVGRSLLMSPFNDYFTWMTTDITEILEERDGYVKFRTRNSNYELWKLENVMETRKRLSREQKWDKAVVDLINEMFIIAGHEVTYDDIKDRKDAWYQEWTMTMQQYEDWKLWGKKYLMKNLRLRATIAERDMAWVGLMWGLKCRDYEEYIKSNDTTGV